MSRILSLAACVVVSVLAGCSGRSTFTDGRFVVGFDEKFAPYGFRDGSGYKGFDLDLARAVCEKYGWQFVPAPLVWESKDSKLRRGEIDCIWSGFTIQGRERDYAWTSPYVDNSQIVMVKSGSAISAVKGLKGVRVGVQSGSAVAKALSGGGKMHDRIGKTFSALVGFADFEHAISALSLGEVGAIIIDQGVARRTLNGAPGKFSVLAEPIMSDTYGVGFRKGDEKLRDMVEDALIELTDDGTMKILAGKYGIDENALTMWKN